MFPFDRAIDLELMVVDSFANFIFDLLDIIFRVILKDVYIEFKFIKMINFLIF
jgi:hypothetical protein